MKLKNKIREFFNENHSDKSDRGSDFDSFVESSSDDE